MSEGKQTVYHEGELEVQARAGVQEMAARIGGGIRSSIRPMVQTFLATQTMLVVGTTDHNGSVWASLLTGQPGFLHAIDEQTLEINAQATTGDPLALNLYAGAHIGLLAIDFMTRHRLRINGRVEAWDEKILVHTEQIYGNCYKYIQKRKQVVEPSTIAATQFISLHTLNKDQQRLISDASTFFIATSHAQRGTDASHRGGMPGFVRILNEGQLEFPDYAGNTMFNTLGNITSNPNAGLLFIDFQTGSVLQLTGKAQIVWDEKRISTFTGAERSVIFDIKEGVQIMRNHPLCERLIEYSPFNPQ